MDSSSTLGKFTLMISVVAMFFAILLVVFFLAARAKGKAQNPLARLIFLGPAVLLLIIGLVVPAIQTIGLSFKNPDGDKWVGIANYKWIFTTPDNWQILFNTFLWVIVVPIAATALGLTLALLLDRMKRESLPKSLIFMPMAISFVGASIIWGLVYEYRDPAVEQVGLLSQLLIWLGIDDPPNWLLWQPWNNFLLMVIMIWIQVGFAMVVLSAAIKAIPMDVVEAAMLDGATGSKLFRKVTVPMIRGTLIVVFTTIMIGTLKVFDIVRVMTNGNFGTQIVANEMYAQSFVQFDYGRGSALAVVLFVGGHPDGHLQHRAAAEGAVDPMSVEADEVVPDPGSARNATETDLRRRPADAVEPLGHGVRHLPHRRVDHPDLRPAGHVAAAGRGGADHRLVDRLQRPVVHAEQLLRGPRRAATSSRAASRRTSSTRSSSRSRRRSSRWCSRCMAAYGLAWVPFRWSNTLFMLIFALQVVPLQMALLPLLELFNKGWSIGAGDGDPGTADARTRFWPVWIAHTMFALPLAIFLLHNFIAQLPKDLFEAARVDGASHFLIFWKIVLPLSVPAIASFAIFQFLWVWNDLLVALTFAGGTPDVAPITVYLANIKGTYGAAAPPDHRRRVHRDRRPAAGVPRPPAVLRPRPARRLGQGLTGPGERPASRGRLRLTGPAATINRRSGPLPLTRIARRRTVNPYGHFDDAAREYVITRPDTPLPWLNYLGQDEFFGLCTNTGGGYTFWTDAKLRRLTRYRYNNVPYDLGGRYLYVNDGGTVWNPGWKPVKAALDRYECRHGLGYTTIVGEKDGIEVTQRMFVPPGENLELWQVAVRNTSASAEVAEALFATRSSASTKRSTT